MSNTLDYGRRPSRRHWRVIAVSLVLVGAALVAMRSWRAYSARLEDRRLMLEQQKYRQDFDRQFRRQLGPASNPAATSARSSPIPSS
jgi:hypothetical protein